jgi:hypothetical protein
MKQLNQKRAYEYKSKATGQGGTTESPHKEGLRSLLSPNQKLEKASSAISSQVSL